MAQYKVQFVCGHEETISLFGPLKNRESLIAYLEKHGVCSECKKKEYEANKAEFHAKAVANADKYPTLQGSEKQIAWALDIRQKWIDSLCDFFSEKKTTWDAVEQKFNSMSEEQRKQMLELPLSANILCRFAHILTSTSAKFYIDNRDII